MLHTQGRDAHQCLLDFYLHVLATQNKNERLVVTQGRDAHLCLLAFYFHVLPYFTKPETKDGSYSGTRCYPKILKLSYLPYVPSLPYPHIYRRSFSVQVSLFVLIMTHCYWVLLRPPTKVDQWGGGSLYIYIYIHIHTYVYIHTYIHTYIHAHRVCAYMNIRIYIHAHSHIYPYLQLYLFKYLYN